MHVYRNIQELYLTQFSRGNSLYIYKVVVISEITSIFTVA